MTIMDQTRMVPRQDADGQDELGQLCDRVTARLAATAPGGRRSAVEREDAARDVIAAVIGEHAVESMQATRRPLPPEEAERLQRALMARVTGTGGFAQLLADEDIEDVWCNGCDNVWVRRADGTEEPADAVADSDDDLIEMVRMLAAAGGCAEQERRFDRASPILDLRLDDGSRLHAVMAVTERPTVTIRRHRLTEATLEDLQDRNTVTADIAELLRACVAARFNVIIAGHTGVGKTTLLRAVAGHIPPCERVVTMEDSFELGLNHDERHLNAVAMQTRLPNIEGAGGIDMVALFRAGLRMNPSRVIVGEVRGDEAVPMLHAMSQGNDGSLSTIHARSSAGVFEKLTLFGAACPERLDAHVMARLIAESVDLVVHMDSNVDKTHRWVSSIREVCGSQDAMVTSNELYRPGDDGQPQPHAPVSQRRAERLARHGYHTTRR